MLNARRRIAVPPAKTTARDAACLDLHQFDCAESKAGRSCIFADLLIRVVKHRIARANSIRQPRRALDEDRGPPCRDAEQRGSCASPSAAKTGRCHRKIIIIKQRHNVIHTSASDPSIDRQIETRRNAISVGADTGRRDASGRSTSLALCARRSLPTRPAGAVKRRKRHAATGASNPREGMKLTFEAGKFRRFFKDFAAKDGARNYPPGTRCRVRRGYPDHGANCLKRNGFLKLTFGRKAALAIGFERDFC